MKFKRFLKVKNKSHPEIRMAFELLVLDSNQEHCDYQSHALPIELTRNVLE